MATVNEQAILDALHDIPPERWGDVLHYIESLKPAEAVPSRIRTGKDLEGSDLIGIWANRTDIGDSLEFARRLREQASHRQPQQV